MKKDFSDNYTTRKWLRHGYLPVLKLTIIPVATVLIIELLMHLFIGPNRSRSLIMITIGSALATYLTCRPTKPEDEPVDADNQITRP